MKYFYFNVNNKTQSIALKECGVKNVMLSYKYVKKNYDSYVKHYERIFLNPGEDDDIDGYYEFVRSKKAHLATQYDFSDDLEKNHKSWQKSVEMNSPVLPVLHGNYIQNLGKLNLTPNSYVCLGKMVGHIEEDEQLRKLPRSFIYHGLAKGRWMKSDVIESIDSSTWLSGVRGRKTDVYNSPSITFGRKGRMDLALTRAACEKYKEYLELVGLKIEQVLEGDYRALLKIPIALYYMPMFKTLGVFEENFHL